MMIFPFCEILGIFKFEVLNDLNEDSINWGVIRGTVIVMDSYYSFYALH